MLINGMKLLTFRDYKAAGGVCKGSNADVNGGWQTSDKECKIRNDTVLVVVEEGLCSNETIQSVANYQCFEYFLTRKRLISRGILHLIFGMCDTQKILSEEFWASVSLTPPFTKLNPLNDISFFQLATVGGPDLNFTVTSRLDYENTRHRYSWICSLRDPDRNFHYCSVTLLSKPPKPTVLVTSAHCTFICKSEKV